MAKTAPIFAVEGTCADGTPHYSETLATSPRDVRRIFTTDYADVKITNITRIN